MPYIQPEVIQQAKRMDLLTYLRNYEPEELVQFSGDTYTTKSHDSLKISNGVWCWFSQGIGGRSALDYLVKVKDYSFVDAVEKIVGRAAEKPPVFASTVKKDTTKKLLLPEKSPSTQRVEEYLTGRGIDSSIIQEFIQKELLFESMPNHNAVFIGCDEKNIPRYAAYRSTGTSRFIGDATGSDKQYSFRWVSETSDQVHLFESSIDLLSYATIMKMQGRNWQEVNLLSLAGVYQPKSEIAASKVPTALSLFLKMHPQIKQIILHLDNDRAGKMASKALQTVLPKQFEVQDSPAPSGKDVNDWLCTQLGLNRSKNEQERTER